MIDGETTTAFATTPEPIGIAKDPARVFDIDSPIITSGDPNIVTASALPDAIKDSSYSITLTAAGGATPYTWALVSGTLPAGLSFTSGGVLSGTPTSVESKSFVVSITDHASRAVTKGFSILVNPSAGLPNVDYGLRFNDWVANKTTGAGGDYVDGVVWMPAGTYYCDPFDLSTSTYVRAFNAGKPNNNWLTFKEYDGPGTVIFDLRPESAASALGQSTTAAYNDPLHGGAFQNLVHTAGSVRWCFDGGFVFRDGSIHGQAGSSSFGVPGMDRVIFHGTTHRFDVSEWRRQFDIVYTLRTGSAPAAFLPNDSPDWIGLGGSGTGSGGPYWRTYNEGTQFKANNQPTPFRLDGVTKFAIIRADVGPCGDDCIFVGAGSANMWVIGSLVHEAGELDGGVLGPASSWFHPDTMQITGSFATGGMLDCTHKGHVNIAAEAGNVSGLVMDRVWQGDCVTSGGSLYVSGYTMGNTNHFGTGAPATRVTGHFYKGFSNGITHNDGGAQVARDNASGGANTWHAVMTDYGGHSASVAFTLAVPSGCTVDGNGFLTSALSTFTNNSLVPHKLFQAAYATSELAAVMTDYSIAFD